LFLLFLSVLGVVASLTEPAGSTFAYGRTALVIFLLVAAVAGVTELWDRTRSPSVAPDET
jgi:hypothetical protein